MDNEYTVEVITRTEGTDSRSPGLHLQKSSMNSKIDPVLEVVVLIPGPEGMRGGQQKEQHNTSCHCIEATKSACISSHVSYRAVSSHCLAVSYSPCSM